jgi:hypothetical protein
MFPLLLTALLIWAGVFAFVLGLERKVAALEKRLAALPPAADEPARRAATEELGR